ncbi:MAG: hypothetical protein ACXVR9_16355, partial [Gaiellaceae bacterium]
MNFIDERIEQYATEHTTPPAGPFERLERETYETQPMPEMMMGALASTFLAFVTRLKAPSR